MAAEINRVDTLIITVGTRQVGWRSPDGIVRCFGADGDRNHPQHINELYQELGIDRGHYEDGSLWGVRDLGDRYYQLCQASGNFSQVELLLDLPIVAKAADLGLKQIILLATNQPETVPWNYRRADTLWLAELMKGKIAATWPKVLADVWDLKVNANDREAIRHELENAILPLALEAIATDETEPLVLAIQNKGAVPALAEGLEICAAALVRQYQVFNANPQEPQPLYQPSANGSLSACTAEKYEFISVSSYFWPLERMQVISAWKRGDFLEAQVWLKAHQNRYKALCQLAGYLARSTNWEIASFINNKDLENGWLKSKAVRNLTDEAQIEIWRDRLLKLRQDELAEAWESTFLMELQLHRDNYTAAFVQFAQTLERLLYIRCQKENWIGNGKIKIRPDLKHLGKKYQPSFQELIDAWLAVDSGANFKKLLTAIRDRRNKIIHQAQPVTLPELRSLWANNGFPVPHPFGSSEVVKVMKEMLQKVCPRNWTIPQTTLLRSLYDWGLSVIK